MAPTSIHYYSASRLITIVLTTALACVSFVAIPSVELGLDQQLSMPKDSHIVKYFQVRISIDVTFWKLLCISLLQYMSEYLEMGAPIFWVITPGINYTLRSGQNIVCGGQECYQDSAAAILYMNSKYSEM